MSIRVVIADDHAIVRSGIRNELQRDGTFDVAGEALTGDDTIRLVETLAPEILLLDISMPGKKAIDIVQELKQMGNHCRILILSAHSDVPTIIGMIKAGVDGYILKDEDPSVITEAIQAILKGDTWLSPGVSDRLASIIDRLGDATNTAFFTSRELEVCKRVAAGSTNREIAVSLQMAERTVEFHIGNILRKMGSKGRLEAVLKAKELGLL